MVPNLQLTGTETPTEIQIYTYNNKKKTYTDSLWLKKKYFRVTWIIPIQHYVIKCVSELRQVGDFLRVFRFPPPINRTWIVSRVIYILIVNLTLLLTYLVCYCTVRPYIPSAILPSFYQKFIVQPFRQPAIIQIWKPGQSYFKDRPKWNLKWGNLIFQHDGCH
jgi:hypothetical protein